MIPHTHRRLKKNAPGDWYTTGACLACETPELEAPELLSPLSNQDLETYFVRQPASAEEVEKACRAAQACCVNSLRYGGQHPVIIQRLGNSSEYCDWLLDSSGSVVYAHGPDSRRPWWKFWASAQAT